MSWYKTLTINQKITVKALCGIITGVSFEELGLLFNFEERINIIYNKLKREGFDI